MPIPAWLFEREDYIRGDDYLERVYAGVLGKLVGVYLGRPFEGWTHQRILDELGPIRYYVHEKLNQPLVVTDDDVSGTFIFLRALEEHGCHPVPSSESIGKTWLNNVIEHRSIFWWGGNGISTEHTAYLNLKRGIPAPQSGSITTNGKTVAEQIGAQIFIDGNVPLATKLAEAAGSVSHDGESVYAAKLLAAMEAEAFFSKNVNHLIDKGLEFIPSDCLLATVISDIRAWHKEDNDWLKTRQRIEDKYGYDKFLGNCHVIPNHGIMILALLYGGHDFHEAMYLISTCGWDTDCNAGNIGCLVAIMHGLKSFQNGPDWLGPLADRCLISSADAGYSINNAARIAYDVVNLGRKLAGERPLQPPKDGAQFHFSLPGSVQGFQTTPNTLQPSLARVEQGEKGLAIRLHGVTTANQPIEVLTQTFTPPEILQMRTYDLCASPLVYPGQTVKALCCADTKNAVKVNVQLRFKFYSEKDSLATRDGPSASLAPGREEILQWTIPDDIDYQPIQKIGLAISIPTGHLTGTVWLKYLRWDGSPRMTLMRPTQQPGDFWRQAWVNGASIFHKTMGAPFYIAQDHGEGIVLYGTREWTDYQIKVHKFRINLGSPAGVAVRVQGLRRYYALVFKRGGQIAFVKNVDDQKIELSSTTYEWSLDASYDVAISVQGSNLKGYIDEKQVMEVKDERYGNGGIGFVVTNGSVSANRVDIMEPR